MLHVLPVFIGAEGVHLDPEGHAFLAAVLPGGELGADAVHLVVGEDRGLLEVAEGRGTGGGGGLPLPG